MQSNALRKIDDAQDNAAPAQEPWEVTRARIAQACEAACGLPGNKGSADFEDMIIRLRLRDSAFA